MTEIVQQQRQELATVQPASIDIVQILRSAIDSGRPMSEYKEALELAERIEAIRRESLFNEAFAAFKRDCPPIQRRTQDEYITVSRNGVRGPRMYASLDDISRTCDPHLHKHGLTYDWTDAELTADGCIVRRFVLRHVAGHSRHPVASPPVPIEGGEAYKKIDKDRKATSASPQQRMGVADTYAKRYSMTAGLGIPTCDEDDESVMHANEQTITDHDVLALNDALIDVGANVPAFLGIFKIEKLADLPASKLADAWKLIEKKRKAKK